MIQKRQIKIVLDVIMSVAILFLIAYPIIGEEGHEWMGAGMLILFLLHNLLNFGWYKALFKGKYSLQRAIQTGVNLLTLISIVLSGYSGIAMSKHLFTFLPLYGGMATARILHLACTSWAFVLMSIHLGIHWSMIINKMFAKQKANFAFQWIMRAVATAVALYGAYLFGKAEFLSNMFLLHDFAILDYETPMVIQILKNIAMMSTWVYVGHYLIAFASKVSAAKRETQDKKKRRVYLLQSFLRVIALAVVIACAVISTPAPEPAGSWGNTAVSIDEPESALSIDTESDTTQTTVTVTDEFVLIQGGVFQMGSPETENWRSDDETEHQVTVDSFYISAYELTQQEYEAIMGNNPSDFKGEKLPVETVSWLDAVRYCNARSEQEGLTPVYTIDGENVSWNRGTDGYRLPTEAEWEYACRAGTVTPFNTETSISPEESNYYGHYPYEIEGNYFSQGDLTTKPGQYRETTIAVDSFEPNKWGLYNMHGNVSEWVWDYYGDYGTESVTNPTGAETGTLKVYRGGAWNDFAKNMRSAYRATLEKDMGSFNIGIRLVRNAVTGSDDIVGTANSNRIQNVTGTDSKALIAYFSWGGNTQGVAEEIQAQTGADIFEITMEEPYSSDYNTVLDQAQHDQNIQARPALASHVENMDEYDTILIGYPNWWASIPMPIASFLEEYDMSGKTIIPFCSNGGGRFGQSLTAIAKLAPTSVMGEGLSIHYSGGSSLSQDVTEWLRLNEVIE